MRQTLRNTKGFTLIELMIVIAIIGILAAIAIPNFISYRNKSFCTAAESDANSVAAALGDYFSVPTITQLPQQATAAATYDLSRTGKASTLRMSGKNTVAVTGNSNDTITIQVTDGQSRCPSDYRSAMVSTVNPTGYWRTTDYVYTKSLKP